MYDAVPRPSISPRFNGLGRPLYTWKRKNRWYEGNGNRGAGDKHLNYIRQLAGRTGFEAGGVLPGKRRSGLICRNGPKGALHKSASTPFSSQHRAGKFRWACPEAFLWYLYAYWLASLSVGCQARCHYLQSGPLGKISNYLQYKTLGA